MPRSANGTVRGSQAPDPAEGGFPLSALSHWDEHEEIKRSDVTILLLLLISSVGGQENQLLNGFQAAEWKDVGHGHRAQPTWRKLSFR